MVFIHATGVRIPYGRPLIVFAQTIQVVFHIDIGHCASGFFSVVRVPSHERLAV